MIEQTSGPQPDQTCLLKAELKELRRWGVRRLPERIDLPVLEAAADALSPEATWSVDRQIRSVLAKAAESLPEARAEAMAELLDFADVGGKRLVKDRRPLAAAKVGAKPGYFRNHLESEIIGELAYHLNRLYVEHRDNPPRPPDTQASHPAVSSAEPSPNAKPIMVATLTDKAPTRPKPLRYWVGIVVSSILLTLGLVFDLMNSNGPRRVPVVTSSETAALPGDCTRTTAQLFDPYVKTHRIIASSELYMYVPHQQSPDTHHGWVKTLEYGNPAAHIEVIHSAEGRQFALSYHNYTNRLAQGVIARVALPPGASLVPQSVCLYRHNKYRYGTRYTSNALVQYHGQLVGDYTPGASAYLTFSALLPDVRHLSCGSSEVAISGKASIERLDEPNWSQNASSVVIHFEHRCH